MKKSILFLIMVCPLALAAQTSDTTGWTRRQTTKVVDSADYYRSELNKIWRNAFDSLRKTEQVVFLLEQRRKIVARRNNYSALMIYSDLIHSDYAGLNSSIAQSGFPAMNAYSSRFGMGIGNKRNRILYDFYFFTVGFENRSKNADKTIKTSLANFFQVDIGVDILKSDVVSLYPFAGISGRISTLNYKGSTQTNPNFTDISNIIVSKPEVYSSSIRLGYQAGIGLDLRLGGNASHTHNTILFVKGGTNQPFKKDTYKIESYTYNPGIKQADWLVTVGFKFASKR